MIHSLIEKKSKNVAIARSVCVVIIGVSIYDIFRKIWSVLSNCNQRIEYEAGEVVDNHEFALK